MQNPSDIRPLIAADRLADEATLLDRLIAGHGPDAATRARAARTGADLVRAVRDHDTPGLMEVFLAEYGLSTDEGVALMCLAEALLRVPDAQTMDALIEDKIAPSRWGQHLGHSASSLVNASTWALMLTGKVLREDEHPGVTGVLKGAVKRLGEPVIRAAVARAMKELGQQFVLGETIDAAIKRGKADDAGLTYSFDMLGEAALTADDAQAYFDAYAQAIERLSREPSPSIAQAPGISIKLSALHPRYEAAQKSRVVQELVPRVTQLARAAANAGIGLNIDAEEADRLDLSLDVVEAALRDPALAGWDGFGIVVQAYGQRADRVIDWFYALAETTDRRVTLRLVKGAYWDSEIKHAQIAGLSGFPVFTRKVATDAAYLCLANKLLCMTDRIYPQFATHNAHTMAAILAMAGDVNAFEFQRLHGMGSVLHDMVRSTHKTRHRVYAPVGAHRDLLAYLVRRLLENGANSSFVHQILDENVAPEAAAADPFDALPLALDRPAAGVDHPADLFGISRQNAAGWELSDDIDMSAIDAARAPYRTKTWKVSALMAGDPGPVTKVEIHDPTTGDLIGHLAQPGPAAVKVAANSARPWADDAQLRAQVLNRAADLYEAHHGELFAILAREAGKCLPDALSELREAVDFLRYYANQAQSLTHPARGTIAAISPWNFPLAIFTGQIAAALAAGNAVLAKPAEATPIVAFRAVELLLAAGVPPSALQLLPGTGPEVGAALTANPDIAGVSFTGSTATAQMISRSMADHLPPEASLIAETGGLNAMIVDSTALPEQAVRDIITSAFQSAGQRCSALRILYVQEDVAESLTKMLTGAMDELTLGEPWALSTDIGPVIDAEAQSAINAYVDAQGNRVIHRIAAPKGGFFVGPALIKVNGIGDLEKEVFGPVLHIATFRAEALDSVVDDINAKGFGLTFGMHSRIDDRVAQVTARIRAGNIYINRNQIGAVVESQPFGGEGLSGTGPKAGGPNYVPRLCRAPSPAIAPDIEAPRADLEMVARALATRTHSEVAICAVEMAGPTGESNRLSQFGRGVTLCLGPTAAAAREQGRIVAQNGGAALLVAPGLGAMEGVRGLLAPEDLGVLDGFDLVADWSNGDRPAQLRRALANRAGPIILLATGYDLDQLARVERHISIDTTAAGGNARLLASTG